MVSDLVLDGEAKFEDKSEEKYRQEWLRVDFSGGPVVKSPAWQGREHGSDP